MRRLKRLIRSKPVLTDERLDYLAERFIDQAEEFRFLGVTFEQYVETPAALDVMAILVRDGRVVKIDGSVLLPGSGRVAYVPRPAGIG